MSRLIEHSIKRVVPAPSALTHSVQRILAVGACLCVFCVGPLCGPPLRWWVLCGALPSVWVPCVGPLCRGSPLCGSPVWVPCVGPSSRCVSCGIYSRDASCSFTRSRLLSAYDNVHPHTADLPPADASGTGLAGPYRARRRRTRHHAHGPRHARCQLAANAFDAAAADITLAAPDMLAADAFGAFHAATPDPNMLAFGSPYADTLDTLPPAASASAEATAGPAHRRYLQPAPRQHFPPGAQHDFPPPRSRREPSLHAATDDLPAESPYKVKTWLLHQIQRDLASALHRIIEDSHLADKIYDSMGLGFAMLVSIEKFIIAHMASPQAKTTANFARSRSMSQILDTPLLHTSSNCAHTFNDSVSRYLEVAGLCARLCTDADLLTSHHVPHAPRLLAGQARLRATYSNLDVQVQPPAASRATPSTWTTTTPRTRSAASSCSCSWTSCAR